MDTRRFVRSSFLVLGLASAFGLGTAVGQQSPPKENKGVATERTGTLDLAGEIEGMQGRQLRLRVIKGEPGAVFGIHSHKDRPAVAFVMQGTLTEHPEGGAAKEHREGATLTEGKDTTHWAENKGTTPVMLVVADILKP
jgi:quercetin dioxygenase-like cupin family protein